MTGTQTTETKTAPDAGTIVEGSDEHKAVLWNDLEKPGQPFGTAEDDASGETTIAKPAKIEATETTEDKSKAAAEADLARPSWVPEADWQASSPSLRKAIVDQTSGSETRLTQQHSRFKGVISGQTRKIAELMGQTKTTGEGDTKLKAELETFEKEYPDVAGPMKKLIDIATAPLKASVEELDKTAWTEHLALQDTAIHSLHPDYDKISNSKAFGAWFVENQHIPSIREAVERNGEHVVDAEEVGAVVTLFKAQTGYQPEGAAKPAAAAAPATPTKTKTETKRALQQDAAAGSSSSVAPAGPAIAPENDPAALWAEAGVTLDRKFGRRTK